MFERLRRVIFTVRNAGWRFGRPARGERTAILRFEMAGEGRGRIDGTEMNVRTDGFTTQGQV